VRVLPLPPSPGVWCDPDVFDTALGNLVANALEHGGKQTPVDVGVTLEERAGVLGACFSVRDHGAGVPADQRGGLFERFGEARLTGGGMGLGLALTRELTELHAGHLDADWPDDGGSRFRIWIPLGVAHLSLDEVTWAPSGPTPRVESPAPITARPAVPADVLLVEDNDDLRVFLAEHMSTFVSVVAVADAEAALAHLAEQPAQLVVTDIPGSMIIILISARAEVEDRVEGLSVAEDYLAKPFSVRELRARILARLRRDEGDVRAAEARQEARPAWAREFIEKLERYADDHIAEPDLGPERLARSAGMSARTFSERLSELGLPPPAAWLRERRLVRAEEFVRRGTYQTVFEVAAAVGMSRSYFSRAFRARVGRSPGSFTSGE
jgi:AraC-like DNA-binding protein